MDVLHPKHEWAVPSSWFCEFTISLYWHYPSANDGHDTNVTFASKFAIDFLTPLLKNPHFNGPKTLISLSTCLQVSFEHWVMLTRSLAFDENETGSEQNTINTVLLGKAVPDHLVGTEDSAFYTHYSDLATVEANWKLHTLGRYDVGANVFSFVAKETGDITRTLPNLDQTFLNSSYPGVFNTKTKAPLPVPNTSLVVNHRTVLPAIVATWGSPDLQKCTTYNGSVIVPSGANPPVLPAGC